ASVAWPGGVRLARYRYPELTGDVSGDRAGVAAQGAHLEDGLRCLERPDVIPTLPGALFVLGARGDLQVRRLRERARLVPGAIAEITGRAPIEAAPMPGRFADEEKNGVGGRGAPWDILDVDDRDAIALGSLVRKRPNPDQATVVHDALRAAGDVL